MEDLFQKRWYVIKQSPGKRGENPRETPVNFSSVRIELEPPRASERIRFFLSDIKMVEYNSVDVECEELAVLYDVRAYSGDSGGITCVSVTLRKNERPSNSQTDWKRGQWAQRLTHLLQYQPTNQTTTHAWSFEGSDELVGFRSRL
jgi:hypothetical protein